MIIVKFIQMYFII